MSFVWLSCKPVEPLMGAAKLILWLLFDVRAAGCVHLKMGMEGLMTAFRPVPVELACCVEQGMVE